MTVPPVSAQDSDEATKRYLEGNWGQAVSLYRSRAAALDPEDRVRYGEALARTEAFDEADAELLKVERGNGSADREVVLRAMAARIFMSAEKGGAEEALVGLKVLAEQEPESYWVRLYLGRALKSLRRWEDALTELYEAKRVLRRQYWVHFEIGDVYEQLLMFDLAMEAYEESLYYNPRYAQAINNLGYCYKEKSVLYTGVTLYSYAVDKYLEAIAIQPDNAGFYYNVGNAYTHLGKLDKAFEAYSHAVELDPTFAKAHFNLGRTWQRYGKLERAIEEFELYLKFGNQAIFDFILQPEDVRDEIESMKKVLKRRKSGSDD